MTLPVIALILGLVALVWSADRFVEGAVGTARYFGVPSLFIGMLVIGFGTSAPEMVVSGLSAFQGNPGIALGNAFGSNIANIALILGATALISPIPFPNSILKKELPILTGITLFTLILVWDGNVSRWDGLILLSVFAFWIGNAIYKGLQQRQVENSAKETVQLDKQEGIGSNVFWLLFGFFVLLGSSRAMVWGAVEVARFFEVSDMVIGLTVVAIGTSLPELASSIMAAKKGEHNLALGNVIGSNLFNTLTVIGIASCIRPFNIDSSAVMRDGTLMLMLTLGLFCFGFSWRREPARIKRWGGSLLLTIYLSYVVFLVIQTF
jgi:cation:H+ antiporter